MYIHVSKKIMHAHNTVWHMCKRLSSGMYSHLLHICIKHDHEWWKYRRSRSGQETSLQILFLVFAHLRLPLLYFKETLCCYGVWVILPKESEVAFILPENRLILPGCLDFRLSQNCATFSWDFLSSIVGKKSSFLVDCCILLLLCIFCVIVMY